jgi:hypothetical protein
LYPSRLAIFDAELGISLEGIAERRARQGIRVGQVVAARLVAHRANDGWNATPPPYVLPLTAGNWQPTPPAFAAAGLTHYPAVLPFAITSNTQFSPNPPPTLTSTEYASAFNEVKEIGSAISTTRAADQTLVAQLWANVNTPTTVFFDGGKRATVRSDEYRLSRRAANHVHKQICPRPVATSNGNSPRRRRR